MEADELVTALEKVFAPAVEMQRLASKAALTAEEVQKLFGISKTRLEHLRMENRGPQYTRLADRGSVLYTPDSIRKWMQMNAVVPRAV